MNETSQDTTVQCLRAHREVGQVHCLVSTQVQDTRALWTDRWCHCALSQRSCRHRARGYQWETRRIEDRPQSMFTYRQEADESDATLTAAWRIELALASGGLRTMVVAVKLVPVLSKTLPNIKQSVHPMHQVDTRPQRLQVHGFHHHKRQERPTPHSTRPRSLSQRVYWCPVQLRWRGILSTQTLQLVLLRNCIITTTRRCRPVACHRCTTRRRTRSVRIMRGCRPPVPHPLPTYERSRCRYQQNANDERLPAIRSKGTRHRQLAYHRACCRH